MKKWLETYSSPVPICYFSQSYFFFSKGHWVPHDNMYNMYLVPLWFNFQSLVAHGNILLPFWSNVRAWLPMAILHCPLGQFSELGCLWQYLVTLRVNFLMLLAHGNIWLFLGSTFWCWLPMAIYHFPLDKFIGTWLPMALCIWTNSITQINASGTIKLNYRKLILNRLVYQVCHSKLYCTSSPSFQTVSNIWKRQLGHSYTFWTMPNIILNCPLSLGIPLVPYNPPRLLWSPWSPLIPLVTSDPPYPLIPNRTVHHVCNSKLYCTSSPSFQTVLNIKYVIPNSPSSLDPLWIPFGSLLDPPCPFWFPLSLRILLIPWDPPCPLVPNRIVY